MADHHNLLTALCAFQAEMPTLPEDATNPHFRSKYCPLDTIVETATPILTKHGLAWSAFPCRDEHGPALRYSLGHGKSGETIGDTMSLLAIKQDPQGQGSALTYARRYALCSVLNLVADDDDDGNAAGRTNATAPRSTPARSKPTETKTTAPPPAPAASGTAPKAAKADLDELRKLAKAAGWDVPTLALQLVAVDALNSAKVDEAAGDDTALKREVGAAMVALKPAALATVRAALDAEIARKPS